MRTAIPSRRSVPALAVIRGPQPGQGNPGAGFEGFPGGFASGETADLSDLFEGLFGAASSARGRRQSSPGGFRQRGRAPQKGPDVAYRLKVPFVDAATLAPQRITLADGKTIDLKLPKGIEDGTRIRLTGKGQAGPAGNGDAIVTVSIAAHPFYTRDGNQIRLTLPVTLNEAVLGAKVKVPTPEGPVMLTIAKGTTSGKVLRLKERGFTDRSGKRGDQLVTVDVDLPPADAELEEFAKRWKDDRNPRAALGV
jgi:DnaJ-class molecular chaperone